MPTKIEWCDETWNPVTGCSPVSEGCENCYAERMARRLRGRHGYNKADPFKVKLHPDRLDIPLHWRKPRRPFVCSMGDLFHEDVPDEFQVEVIRRIAQCPQHTFLLLTKRPERMACWDYRGICWPESPRGHAKHPDYLAPLKNLWLGVTCENQARADERIPILLQIPAAVRFVSVEPMLGPVDLELAQCTCPWPVDAVRTRHLLDCPADMRRPEDQRRWALDWVICGGESGSNARPMHPDWARGLRDQCQAAGVPFFFKQWGEWIHTIDADHAGIEWRGLPYEHDGLTNPAARQPNAVNMVRVGKKNAGRALDGREWNEYPGGEGVKGNEP